MAFLASLTPREQEMLAADLESWSAKVPQDEQPSAGQAFADGWCLGYLHSIVEPGNQLPAEQL